MVVKGLSGQRGRPRYRITEKQLQFLIDRQFTLWEKEKGKRNLPRNMEVRTQQKLALERTLRLKALTRFHYRETDRLTLEIKSGK